jgi:hypothetical protein
MVVQWQNIGLMRKHGGILRPFEVSQRRKFDSSSSYSFIRYGVVGNMSGFHPVASGSIPGIGLRP